MSRRLVFLLAAAVFLAISAALFIHFWPRPGQAERKTNPSTAGPASTSMGPTSAKPERLPSAPVDADGNAVPSPQLEVAEYPGRRVVLSGRISTAEERGAVIQAIQAELPDGFHIDNRARLDYQCSQFAWLSAWGKIDFSIVKDIHRFTLTVTNTRVTLSGGVSSHAAAAKITQQIQAALPEGVSLQDHLQSTMPPHASLTVWEAPDQTLLVSGTVPEGDAQRYLEMVSEAMPGLPVVDDLVEDRFVAAPPWKQQVEQFLPAFLQTTQRAGLEIAKGNRVKIEGITQAKAIPGLRQRLATSFPSPGFHLEMGIQLGVPTETKLGRPEVGRPKTEEPSAPQPAAPAKTVAEFVATAKIYFGRGQSKVDQLTAAEVAKLDSLGQLWQQESFKEKVYVFGFTDPSGDPETNLRLSKARGENVVAHLSQTYGIDPSSFEIVGTPDDHPPEMGKANELRRVEFSLTSQPSQAPVANWAAAVAPDSLLRPITFQDLYAENRVILFGSGKITPSKEARESLARLGYAIVLEKIEDMVIVYGYAAGKRSPASNRWYAKERCQAVTEELTNNGVAREQIVIRLVTPARAVVPDEDGNPAEDDPEKETNGEKDGDEETDDEENGEPDESDPEENPGRVELVLMSRTVFEKAVDETRAQTDGAKDPSPEQPGSAPSNEGAAVDEDPPGLRPQSPPGIPNP